MEYCPEYCRSIERFLSETSLDNLKGSKTSSEFERFKQDPSYTKVLEHVTYKQGEEYLKLCQEEFKLSHGDILGYTSLNDKQGSPTKYEYSSDLTCSPTSLRYAYHAHLILRDIKERHHLTEVSIVEIGCGYGGLTLALWNFAPSFNIVLREYHLLDLDEPLLLQQKYLLETTVPPDILKFHSAKTYGRDTPTGAYVISNYCLSELDKKFSHGYIDHLILRAMGGFLIWNTTVPIDLGRKFSKERETPLTGPHNYFIYF